MSEEQYEGEWVAITDNTEPTASKASKKILKRFSCL